MNNKQYQHLLSLLQDNVSNPNEWSNCFESIRLNKLSIHQLQRLQNLLLFSLAYPVNKQVHKAVETCYLSFKDYCLRFCKSYFNVQLPGADIIANFSLELIQDLTLRHQEVISYDTSMAKKHTQSDLIQTILFGCEKERFESESYSLNEWFQTHHISRNERLHFLISRFEESFCKAAARDYLFDQLQIQIRLKQSDGQYFHEILKPKNIATTIAPKQDLTATIKLNEHTLTSAQQDAIIHNSRLVLASGFRETDPITHASNVRHITTPSGFEVMLFSMHPKRRLALESYIGYMVYRNGVACAYGGGWIFLNQCKIGISIFPYLRGGASSELFSELMHTYKQLFHISTFTVEPYQFGRNNNDGIKSGAFWFYYKHGFRPVDEKLFQLADSEWKKIKTNKSYRSDKKVLKQLADGDIQLQHDNNRNDAFIHPYLINNICTSQYEKFHHSTTDGKGILLIKNHSKELSRPEKKRMENNYIPFYSTLACIQYSKKEAIAVKNWIHYKVKGDEYEAIKHQQMLYSLFMRISSLKV